ncbi:hypothetical protein [Winogradskyella thalassocola]|uniref:DUF4468 domain-containing protein n=1 Tax=Winogradskyella thalassocola TaxID=262004 RepID=A0A1G8B9E9_9FLAO|nr:hypothetical protein [Winogradskyella thalassocola]SDH29872.1 hypothetical protein SAMN04489796_102200 [Winogradskyella thalassocola]
MYLKKTIFQVLIILFCNTAFTQNDNDYFVKKVENGVDEILKLNEFLNENESISSHTFVDINENKYLFTQSYSGGAHCCTIVSAYKYDNTNNYFIFADSFMRDGDSVTIENYPFEVFSRVNYFYTCYACFKFLDCDEFYQDYYIIENNSFKLISSGALQEMITCFKEQMLSLEIPNLDKNGMDNGERSLILNQLNKIFKIQRDIKVITDLYKNYVPEFENKYELWAEMVEIIM